MSDSPSRIVVIGGGLAGAKAVEALREKGYDGALTLVADEGDLPYERPPLSKDYLQGKVPFEKAVVHPEDWYASHDVDLRRSTAAIVARPRRAGGHSRRRDDARLRPTAARHGAVPRRLAVPGAEAALYLRIAPGLGHAARGVHRRCPGGDHRRRLDRSRDCGRGPRRRRDGHPARDGRTAPRSACSARRWPRCSPSCIASTASTCGWACACVRSRPTTTASRLRCGSPTAASTPTRCSRSRDRAGGLALARLAGLDVDNGILVDASLRTSDPAICAVGDIANHDSPVVGTRIRVEHWANALNQPAAAAASMLGGDEARYDRLPYFFSDQYDLGHGVRRLRTRDGYDKVVVRGDLDGREFVAFWLDADRHVSGGDERQRLGRRRRGQADHRGAAGGRSRSSGGCECGLRGSARSNPTVLSGKVQETSSHQGGQHLAERAVDPHGGELVAARLRPGSRSRRECRRRRPAARTAARDITVSDEPTTSSARDPSTSSKQVATRSRGTFSPKNTTSGLTMSPAQVLQPTIRSRRDRRRRGRRRRQG